MASLLALHHRATRQHHHLTHPPARATRQHRPATARLARATALPVRATVLVVLSTPHRVPTTPRQVQHTVPRHPGTVLRAQSIARHRQTTHRRARSTGMLPNKLLNKLSAAVPVQEFWITVLDFLYLVIVMDVIINTLDPQPILSCTSITIAGSKLFFIQCCARYLIFTCF